MEMQNQIKEYVALYESEVRKLADQLRNESMPQLTEELFSEFETNGNRMRYEAVYFGRRKFLSVLGLASVIWHEKEDIQKLEEVIREICAEECWALPAHVRRKENPNWRGVIDRSENAPTVGFAVIPERPSEPPHFIPIINSEASIGSRLKVPA